MNTKAYDKLNYTMAIVGAAADGKRHGCIVNSFAQVTSSYPAKFVVSVNTDMIRAALLKRPAVLLSRCWQKTVPRRLSMRSVTSPAAWAISLLPMKQKRTPQAIPISPSIWLPVSAAR